MSYPSHFPEEPRLLWNHFFEITQRPRPSKSEDKVREYILEKAKELGLKSNTDSVGNVIVYKNATAGKENEIPVIIQNHMDMVTDAIPEKAINFLTDPITTLREGSWIKADGTTLGADNGIGCAAALALMESRDLIHPPLEILFTIDEETGLKGAWGVEPEFFQGKRMLNLDTEEWGSFYIGCAGGIDYELQGEFPLTQNSFKNAVTKKIAVSGFLGGHSGVDIHEQRGNAIKFLSELLSEMNSSEISVSEIRAGKAHNIIPRDAFAIVTCESSSLGLIDQAVSSVSSRWKSFQPVNDQNFKVDILAADEVSEGLSGEKLGSVLALLNAFPHGAHKYDLASNKELVSLSNNLAKCLFVRGQFYIQTSLRFFDRAECVALEKQVQALGQFVNLKVTKDGEYPSWKPVRENKLLEQMMSVYEGIYHKKPHVTAIHAGLECGILRDKIGPIDAVSFGPTITGAHSPDEKVEIESVSKFWNLLTAVLAKI